MPWTSSTHRNDLPPDWDKRRAAVWRAAGGRCQWLTNGQRCTWTGRLRGDNGQCDHIDRTAGHHLNNLQWLCPTHHKHKTRAEAQTAKPTRQRPPEQHPGINPWGGHPTTPTSPHRLV